jgi:hypothetical protein
MSSCQDFPFAVFATFAVYHISRDTKHDWMICWLDKGKKKGFCNRRSLLYYLESVVDAYRGGIRRIDDPSSKRLAGKSFLIRY